MAIYFAKINFLLSLNPLQPDAFPHRYPFSLSFLPKNPRAKLLSSIITRPKLLSSVVRSSTGAEKHNQDESDSQLLAQRWQEIQGSQEWNGLLYPMDPLLRKELIRYGEMAQACYDAFDKEPYSKYSGSSIYRETEFFQQLGLRNLGYDVTRFMYITSPAELSRFFLMSILTDKEIWSEKANWMGYIAVSNDEMSKKLGRRDITIAWRGTVTQLEWICDMRDILGTISADKIPSPDKRVKVKSGFLDLYTSKDETCGYCKYSASEQVLTEVVRLIQIYSTEKLSISITGHSLGSSLAIINAYDIAERGVNIRPNGQPIPIAVFSFAGPRIGNDSFKNRLEYLGVKVLRVININDIVPCIPGVFFIEHVPEAVMRMACYFPWSYKPVGRELALDHKNSPFLKRKYKYTDAHSLEVYLHLIDGYHGSDKKFELVTGRDYALVNKYTDFLDNKRYRVPPNWKQYENKGMARDGEGRWVQPERSKHDIHHTEMHFHHYHIKHRSKLFSYFVFFFGTPIIIYFLSVITKKI